MSFKIDEEPCGRDRRVSSLIGIIYYLYLCQFIPALKGRVFLTLPDKKILLAMLLLGLIVGCKNPFTPDKTEIKGIIRDTKNDPIAGVTVTLSPGDDKITTDADGYYIFTNVRPNTYTIKAQKTGVGEKSITVKVESTSGLSCYNQEKITAEVIVLNAVVVPDTTSPTIAEKSPAADATNVLVNAIISVKFSEAMKKDTLNTSYFLLYKYETTYKQIDGIVTYDSTDYKATFDPNQNLISSTKYMVRVSNNVQDKAGNPLTSIIEWYFTTQ